MEFNLSENSIFKLDDDNLSSTINLTLFLISSRLFIELSEICQSPFLSIKFLLLISMTLKLKTPTFLISSKLICEVLF